MCQSKKSSWWIPTDRIWPKEEADRLTYFPVRLCNQCNKVWEKSFSFLEKDKDTFHDDFPTLGLKREVCNACIKRKKDKDYKSRRKSQRVREYSS